MRFMGPAPVLDDAVAATLSFVGIMISVAVAGAEIALKRRLGATSDIVGGASIRIRNRHRWHGECSSWLWVASRSNGHKGPRVFARFAGPSGRPLRS